MQVRWQRWHLRRHSFEALVHRVKWIFWAVASFEDPGAAEWGLYSGKVAVGYFMRRTLAGAIAVPDLDDLTTVSVRRAAGERADGREINDLAIYRPTPVDWFHVENDSETSYTDEELVRIAEIAYAAGLRGVYFAQHGRGRKKRKVLVFRATSDLRLRCWLPAEQWYGVVVTIVI